MSPRAQELLREVLALPLEERADVAAQLLASLDDAAAEDPAEVEAAWAAGIEAACPASAGWRNGRQTPGTTSVGARRRTCAARRGTRAFDLKTKRTRNIGWRADGTKGAERAWASSSSMPWMPRLIELWTRRGRVASFREFRRPCPFGVVR